MQTKNSSIKTPIIFSFCIAVLWIVVPGCNYHSRLSEKSDSIKNIDTVRLDTTGLNPYLSFDYKVLAKKPLTFKEFDYDDILDRKKTSSLDNYDSLIVNILRRKDLFREDLSIAAFKVEVVSTIIPEGIYNFKLADKEYIVFFMHNFLESCNDCYMFISLYDITNKKKIIHIPIGYQLAPSYHCFNDFNTDGNLDFVADEKKDTTFSYTLENYKFEKTKFYIIKPFINYEFYIDIKNSLWFFDFKKTFPDKIIYKKP